MSNIENTLLIQSQKHQIESLSSLFERDPNRVAKFSLELEDLIVDFSKHHVDAESLASLIKYAETCNLTEWRQRLFAGERINSTEKRAVLHPALRAHQGDHFSVDQKDVVADVLKIRKQCFTFAEDVREGRFLGSTNKKIKTIVNIGIGGSDLGPQLLLDALDAYKKTGMQVRFISRVDALHVHNILKDLDPETTLFVVASKTFTTQETLANANVARKWLVDKLGEAAVASHFVAVSTNIPAVKAFGINEKQCFAFWDWVGGRYSVWSSIGLSVMILLGADNFQAILDGARVTDHHFQNAPLDKNIPVLMGLLGFWYGRYWKANAQAILAYDESLRILPNYLQQLEMESNGKSVDRSGENVKQPTVPVIFGGLGNDGQHAYYQALHQGTQFVPADFLVAAQAPHAIGDHHTLLLANCLAQSQAMMMGKNADTVRSELKKTSLSPDEIEALVPYKVFKGNIPSTTFIYSHLTPKTLGTLIALYEHKVFVQGILWNINSFDQWGVELGKQMAQSLVGALKAPNAPVKSDPSTAALLKIVHAKSKKPTK